MEMLLIGAVSSVLQEIFIKIKNKNIQIIFSFVLVFVGVLVYDYFLASVSQDTLEKLIGAYGASQGIHKIFFSFLTKKDIEKN
jgi:hypothetical protein